MKFISINNAGWDSLCCPSHKFRAFTLIELLVVVSIIALLLSILLPSLGKAQQQARTLVCLSNMRQVGIALNMYLWDNEERLPDSSCHISDPEKYWLKILSKYTGEQLLFRCPGDEAANFVDWDRPLNEQATDLRWSSFALNELLDSRCPRYNGRYNMVKNIRQPQYCVYIAESPSSWTSADHLHPENWFCNIQLAKGQIAWDRHLGKSNYLFADGHAETLEIEQTYAWPGSCFWFPDVAPGWPSDD